MKQPLINALSNLSTSPQYFIKSDMDRVFNNPTYYEAYDVVYFNDKGLADTSERYSDIDSAFYQFLKKSDQYKGKNDTVDMQIEVHGIIDDLTRTDLEPVVLLTNC